ncbi:MAG: hypothetical protein A2Z75_07710 [Chloroflexi bacterium RBG_13_50_10]|nr:MAG: hypothetical protein A2Z75_07710 [Chloroflexi bacterium RBG_13_50_10]
MKRKTIGVICLLALMAIIGLLQACAEAQPDFEVLSLNITPPQITTGEKATIEVKIRNNDAKTINYNVPLMVNGVADDRKSLTLAPGATELITFALTKSQAGTYRIAVGSRETTLVVEKPLPPEFRLSNLEINPAEVEVGDNVVIRAKVANVGGTQGSYTAELKIDGMTKQTEKLTILAGTDYTLVFKVCRCLPGNYIVTLGGLTGQFVVKEPFRPVINIAPTTEPEPVPCSTRG